MQTLLLPLLIEEYNLWLSNHGSAMSLCKEAREEQQTKDTEDQE